MRFKINKECISCGSCTEVCPNNAIRQKKGTQLYKKMEINQAFCVECGECYEICPVGAIVDLLED